jgi:hypothetical protein
MYQRSELADRARTRDFAPPAFLGVSERSTLCFLSPLPSSHTNWVKTAYDGQSSGPSSGQPLPPPGPLSHRPAYRLRLQLASTFRLVLTPANVVTLEWLG